MTWARAIGLVCLAYLGMIVSTALAALWSGPVPDLGFLVVLYTGLHCRLIGGPAAMLRDAHPESMAGLGAALGYLMDLVGGTPRGLRALTCTLWLLGLRALSNRLMVRGTWAIVGVAVLCTLLFHLSMWLLHVGFALAGSPSGVRNAVGTALFSGICAPLCFAVLTQLDNWLWRDPRTQRGGLSYGRADAKR